MNHPAIRENAVAVVTGAAAGIGFAIAERLCKERMKIVLFDRDEISLANAVCALRQNYPDVQLTSILGDVTSTESLETLYQTATHFGNVSLVVNNAGIIQGANPWQDMAQWRHTMEINFWSVLQIQMLFMNHLIQNAMPAAIVNLGSKEGITTPPGNAAYSVSKAGIKVLTEQLAHEIRQLPNNVISAHLLIPGYTYTPMNFPEMDNFSEKPKAPWNASQVAERLLEGMSQNEFYIFCEDNEVTKELDQKRMQWAADDMIKCRPALSRWHADYQSEFENFIQEKPEQHA
ncbi:SDR family NAD(P)-dependent oxidoreductase [Vibrio furnissii]|uniref:SDR family NAD(P)-dependent oxidoreductase n=1 Tax=Vibrio furnissii TaxID=29494 RepID=UPI0023DBD7BC|nr:SDR family oxidoreductase [Vibrio furnissii]